MISVDEINKLKEKLEIRDNAVEHFRKEAIRWAHIANSCIKDLAPFNDDYFKDLTYEQIAELAKKSIRLTCENRRLERALKKVKEIADNSYSVPCLEHGCDCQHCKDEITQNGEHCMEYGLEKIKQIISECEGENE